MIAERRYGYTHFIVSLCTMSTLTIVKWYSIIVAECTLGLGRVATEQFLLFYYFGFITEKYY